MAAPSGSRPSLRRVLMGIALLAFVALAWWSIGTFFQWASSPSQSLVDE